MLYRWEHSLIYVCAAAATHICLSKKYVSVLKRAPEKDILNIIFISNVQWEHTIVSILFTNMNTNINTATSKLFSGGRLMWLWVGLQKEG